MTGGHPTESKQPSLTTPTADAYQASKSTPLTIRLDGDAGWMSTDDGTTWRLPTSVADFLRTAARETNSAAIPDAISATARASIAEAEANQPRPRRGVHDATNTQLPQTTTVLSLPQPPETAFSRTTLNRRSIRSLGAITMQQLAAVLSPVFRLEGYGFADDGAVTRYRPVPSAGARHPVVPLVVANAVCDLPAGLWRLDADTLTLHHIDLVDVDLEHIWTRLAEAVKLPYRPAAAIVLAVDAEATLSRYPAGISLVWRDAGAAASMVALAATDAGLGSCIAGTAGIVPEPTLRAAGLHGAMVTDMGTILIGSKP